MNYRCKYYIFCLFFLTSCLDAELAGAPLKQYCGFWGPQNLYIILVFVALLCPTTLFTLAIVLKMKLK